MNFFKVLFQPTIKAIYIHYRNSKSLDINISLLQIKYLLKNTFGYVYGPKTISHDLK